MAIDNFTKFAHAVAAQGKTPELLVEAMQEVLAKTGVPKQVHSDC